MDASIREGWGVFHGRSSFGPYAVFRYLDTSTNACTTRRQAPNSVRLSVGARNEGTRLDSASPDTEASAGFTATLYCRSRACRSILWSDV